jgi:hypothetical protein
VEIFDNYDEKFSFAESFIIDIMINEHGQIKQRQVKINSLHNMNGEFEMH